MAFDPNKFRPDPKPVKREKPKKPSRIRPMSKKREAESKVYSTLRDVFLKDKKCPITGEPATDVHHTYSGKDRAAHYLDVKTWIAVSRNGHDWIHANPAQARKLGYLK